jgi:hypothetical protein
MDELHTDEMHADEIRLDEPSGGADWFRIGVALIVLIAIIACVFEGVAWYRQHHAAEVAPAVEAPPAAAPPAPVAVPETPVHPLEPAEAALPATPAAADAALMTEIARLSTTDGLARWIRPTNLVRHIVASVDALPRRIVPQDAMPSTPVPGHLVIAQTPAGPVISPDNAKRYLPWVHLLASVDPAAAAGTYRHFYPLFQQAYRELGYPKGFFNDRLVAAIDDALEAPQPSEALRIESPSVMWRYTDPELESLTAGQKIMLRIGPINAKVVRDWLVAFRAKIA